MNEDLDERFQRLLDLLEKLLSKDQQVHVHVHTNSDYKEPPRPFTG